MTAVVENVGTAIGFAVGYRDLVEAVAATGLVAGGRNAATAMVKITAGDNLVIVHAATSCDSLRVVVGADVEISGDVLVPQVELAKTLAAIAKGAQRSELDRMRVRLTHNMGEETADLQLAGYTLPLMAVAADSYPDGPSAAVDVVTVDRALFEQMHARVRIAASTDTLLPTLTNVALVMAPSQVTMLATDRYRIARGLVDADFTGNDPITVLLPTMTTKVLKACRGPRLVIGAAATDTTTAVTISDGTITWTHSQTNAANFPTLRQFFDVVATTTATAKLASCRQAMIRTRALHDILAERDTAMLMRIRPDSLELVPGAKTGTARAPEIPAETTSPRPGLTVGFNPTYLADALAHMTGDTVTVHITDTRRPITLTGADSYEQVLMPMRITK